MPTNTFVYIRLVFCNAWSHSASATQNIIFFIVAGVGATSLVMLGFGMTVDATHLLAMVSNPKFHAILFGLIVLFRIICAPYWIWTKERDARIKAEEIITQFEQRRAILNGGTPRL